jgi:alkylhydroperoxidase family enzyme
MMSNLPTYPVPTEAELEQRQAELTQRGPRIPPLAANELSAEALKLLEGLIAVNAAFTPRDPQGADDLIATHAAGKPTAAGGLSEATLPPLIATMLRHPSVFARHVQLSAELLGHGALSARDRELLVLRVAWLSGAPFEWGEHVHIAKTSGVSAEEVARVIQGSNAPGWSEHDRALMRAVEELRANAMISDVTWATLALRYDARQLIELPVVVGQYQTIAYYQNSLRVSLHEGNPGLKAR